MTASELRRLGPTSKAFLATDHEPMRMEVRKVLGERLGFPESHLTVFQKQALQSVLAVGRYFGLQLLGNAPCFCGPLAAG